MNIEVVNRRSQTDWYIGRPMRGIAGSALGNPFKAKSRDENVADFRVWLWAKIQANDPAVMAELRAMIAEEAKSGDLRLQCWCAPKHCHGDVIKSALEWLKSQD